MDLLKCKREYIDSAKVCIEVLACEELLDSIQITLNDTNDYNIRLSITGSPYAALVVIFLIM